MTSLETPSSHEPLTELHRLACLVNATTWITKHEGMAVHL